MMIIREQRKNGQSTRIGSPKCFEPARPKAARSRVFAALGLKGYGKRLWSAGRLLIIRDLISFIVYWNCRVVGSEIEFGDWSGRSRHAIRPRRSRALGFTTLRAGWYRMLKRWGAYERGSNAGSQSHEHYCTISVASAVRIHGFLSHHLSVLHDRVGCVALCP